MDQRSSEVDGTPIFTPFNIIESTVPPNLEEDNFPTSIEHPAQWIPTCSTQTTPPLQPPEDDFDDIAWSIYSNTFFLSGGIFYLLATSWDYILFHSSRDASVDDILPLLQHLLYELLWFMGPLTYLLNSIIDVKWALKVRKRDAQRREMEKVLIGKKQKQKIKTSKQDGGEGGGIEIILHENQNIGTNSGKYYSSLSIKQSLIPKRKRGIRKIITPTKFFFRRMRKHMGHRRELAAAVTFGIAAALSVTGATFYLISSHGQFSFVIHSSRNSIAVIDTDLLAHWAGILECASIHMYSISAIFALWRNPCKKSDHDDEADVSIDYNSNTSDSMRWIQTRILLPISRPFNDVDSMETVGDVFFGLASLVDLILEDSTLDENVLWWPIVSAFLWTLDALFYLRGDFVTIFLRKEVLTTMADEENKQMSNTFVDVDQDGCDIRGSSSQEVWSYPTDGNTNSSLM